LKREITARTWSMIFVPFFRSACAASAVRWAMPGARPSPATSIVCSPPGPCAKVRSVRKAVIEHPHQAIEHGAADHDAAAQRQMERRELELRPQELRLVLEQDLPLLDR